uniref:Uncharacterized protein n=1 Tax=Clandestinovirus TaxID=2831644 RepID=A0A8F8PQX1_9VIRU|nr:hypothetical protein KOM_12_265 [Clandestinovirus]
MSQVVRKIANHPMAALTIGVSIGTLLGVALCNYKPDRYENHQVLQQVVPKNVIDHRKDGVKPFQYYTLNVADENNKAVYQGNVLTLWNYPAHYVVVGNHGFELWKKDDLERSIQSMEFPMIRKTSVDGTTVAVPYFIHPPIKRCIRDVDIRGWDGKFFVCSLEFGKPAYNWIVDKSVNGGKVVRERPLELKFVDSDGQLRIATITGMYDHAQDFPSIELMNAQSQSQQQQSQKRDDDDSDYEDDMPEDEGYDDY